MILFALVTGLLGLAASKTILAKNLKDGVRVSFESVNFPQHYMKHGGWVMWIGKYEDTEIYAQDSSFVVRKRLVTSEPADCFSFESENYPGHYVRHSGYRMRISKFEDSDGFKKDATWCVKSAPNAQDAVVFNSVNYRNHYARHRNYQMWMDEKWTDDFQHMNDASFYIVDSLVDKKPDMAPLSAADVAKMFPFGRYISFESVNYPSHFVKRITSNNMRIAQKDADENEWPKQTWIVIPPKDDRQTPELCRSFESADAPGNFLTAVATTLSASSSGHRSSTTFCPIRSELGRGIHLKTLWSNWWMMHYNWEARMGPDTALNKKNNPTFVADCSWFIRDGLFQAPPTPKPTAATPKPTTPMPTTTPEPTTPPPTPECGRDGKGKLKRIGKKKLKSGKLKDASADKCSCHEYCTKEASDFTYFDFKKGKSKKKKGKVKTKPAKCTCYSGAVVSSFKSGKDKTAAGGSALEDFCRDNPSCE